MADEPDWRSIADTLATELRKHGWDHAESDYVESVVTALAVYDDATGIVDAEMAREMHANIVRCIDDWRAMRSGELDGIAVGHIADAILEEFGMER